jgi:hypothetical protein
MFKVVDKFLNNFDPENQTESAEQSEHSEQAEVVEPVEVAEPVEKVEVAEKSEQVEPVEQAKPLESVEKNGGDEKTIFSGLFNFFTKHLVCSTNKDEVIVPSNKPAELETPEATAI